MAELDCIKLCKSISTNCHAKKCYLALKSNFLSYYIIMHYRIFFTALCLTKGYSIQLYFLLPCVQLKQEVQAHSLSSAQQLWAGNTIHQLVLVAAVASGLSLQMYLKVTDIGPKVDMAHVLHQQIQSGSRFTSYINSIYFFPLQCPLVLLKLEENHISICSKHKSASKGQLAKHLCPFYDPSCADDLCS